MHRSRVYALLIDTPEDSAAAAAAFWSAALGVQVAQWLECHVLRAPGGHLLCVIPVHSDPGAFEAEATAWP